jgi:hypothetical protein
VNFDDMLSICLPSWLQHFDDIMIVTTDDDEGAIALAKQHALPCHTTDVFYDHGAYFNRSAAVEEAFDVFGRHGWLCCIDADIILPEDIDWSPLEIGNLYGTRRRLLWDANEYTPELDWTQYKLGTSNPHIWGYFQLFHADDERLTLPWFEQRWRSANIADGRFSRRWPQERRIYLPEEVLHIGPTMVNVVGRTSPRLDGKPIENVERLRRAQQGYYDMTPLERRRAMNMGEDE